MKNKIFILITMSCFLFPQFIVLQAQTKAGKQRRPVHMTDSYFLDSGKDKPNPNVTGILASIFPGAGYFYNGQILEGTWASTLIIPLATPYYFTTPDLKQKTVKVHSYTIASNTFGYTIYDSYQSALDYSPELPRVVQIPHYTFTESLTAIFQPVSYSSWKPWLPIALAASTLASSISEKGISKDIKTTDYYWKIPAIFLMSSFIGMGEESEFRGFQLPFFANLTDSKLLGNLLQGMSFGTCHTSWGICSSPYLTGHIMGLTRKIDSKKEYKAPPSPSDGSDISELQYFISTTLMGSFFGYITMSETDGLKMAMATHALYDALLILNDFLTTNNTGRVYLSISLPLSISN